MKKEWIRNGVALFSLCLLVLYSSLHRKSVYQTKEKEDESKKFAVIDTTKIERMDIKNKNGTITFLKRNKNKNGEFEDPWKWESDEFDTVSDWRIESEFHALPVPFYLSTLLDNVKGLESTKMISENGER